MPAFVKTLRPNVSKCFIDTSRTSRAININLFHVSSLDMWFAQDGVQRDCLTAEFKSLITSVGFRGLQFPGGGINASYTTIPDNTTINGGPGSGYNCSLTNPGEDRCSFPWTKDFFNEFVQLCDDLNLIPSISFNCQLDNANFLTQNEWILERLVSVFGENGIKDVSYGMEDNIGNSEEYWASQMPVFNVPNYTAAYIVRIAARIAAMQAAHPTWNFHIAGQDILRVNEDQVLWGDRLYKTYNGVSLNPQAVKIYAQSNDFFENTPFEFTEDFNYNLQMVNAVFDFNERSKYTFPNIIKRFKEVHHGRSMGVWQHGWLNQGDTIVHDTMLALIFIAKFYKFMLDYNYASNDFICYAAYQNMRNIITNANVPKQHYWGLWVVGKIFKNLPAYIPVYFDYPGLSGVAVLDATDNAYRVLVINESGTARSITVNAGSTTYTGFTRYTAKAASLSSTVITTETIIGEAQAEIAAYSVNVIEKTLS